MCLFFLHRSQSQSDYFQAFGFLKTTLFEIWTLKTINYSNLIETRFSMSIDLNIFAKNCMHSHIHATRSTPILCILHGMVYYIRRLITSTLSHALDLNRCVGLELPFPSDNIRVWRAWFRGDWLWCWDLCAYFPSKVVCAAEWYPTTHCGAQRIMTFDWRYVRRSKGEVLVWQLERERVALWKCPVHRHYRVALNANKPVIGFGDPYRN